MENGQKIYRTCDNDHRSLSYRNNICHEWLHCAQPGTPYDGANSRMPLVSNGETKSGAPQPHQQLSYFIPPRNDAAVDTRLAGNRSQWPPHGFIFDKPVHRPSPHSDDTLFVRRTEVPRLDFPTPLPSPPALPRPRVLDVGRINADNPRYRPPRAAGYLSRQPEAANRKLDARRQSDGPNERHHNQQNRDEHRPMLVSPTQLHRRHVSHSTGDLDRRNCKRRHNYFINAMDDDGDKSPTKKRSYRPGSQRQLADAYKISPVNAPDHQLARVENKHDYADVVINMNDGKRMNNHGKTDPVGHCNLNIHINVEIKCNCRCCRNNAVHPNVA